MKMFHLATALVLILGLPWEAGAAGGPAASVAFPAQGVPLLDADGADLLAPSPPAGVPPGDESAARPPVSPLRIRNTANAATNILTPFPGIPVSPADYFGFNWGTTDRYVRAPLLYSGTPSSKYVGRLAREQEFDFTQGAEFDSVFPPPLPPPRLNRTRVDRSPNDDQFSPMTLVLLGGMLFLLGATFRSRND